MSTIAEEAPPTAALGQLVPISVVHASSLNPRKHRNTEKDGELQQSIAMNGIIEPLIVRPHPQRDGHFEIIAGERRFGAATAAGVRHLPVIIREATDAQLVEFAFTENDQRDGMHPVDDARGLQNWLNLDTALSVDDVAARLGRPVAHIKRRLRLLELDPDVLTAFEEDRITVSHADLLAKVPNQQQKEALAACFETEFDYEKGGDKTVVAPVKKLKRWYEDNVRLQLDSTDAQEEFPELIADLAKETAKGATVLMLTDEWSNSNKPTPDGDPLPPNLWRECKAKDKGARKAVIVEGRRRGMRLHVRLVEPPKPVTSSSSGSAKKSGSTAPAGPSPAEVKKQQETAARERLIRTRAENEGIIQGAKRTKSISRGLLIEVICALAECSIDHDLAEAATKALDLPADVLTYGTNPKMLAKLNPAKLNQALVMFVAFHAMHDDIDSLFKVLGVNLKKITADVTKAIAAEEKAAAKPAKAAAPPKTGTADKPAKAANAAKPTPKKKPTAAKKGRK